MKTHNEIAENFELWGQYVDPDGIDTREAFEAMSVPEKVKMIETMFGGEGDE
jgi:hypothetical protein